MRIRKSIPNRVLVPPRKQTIRLVLVILGIVTLIAVALVVNYQVPTGEVVGAKLVHVSAPMTSQAGNSLVILVIELPSGQTLSSTQRSDILYREGQLAYFKVYGGLFGGRTYRFESYVEP